MSQTLEAETSFSGAEKPSRDTTRRRIDKKGILCTHHTRPLNSLRNILSEHARVYRSVVNGALSTIEGVRLSFILREVRAAMEAVNAETARIEAAEQARAAAEQVEKPPLVVNILPIPSEYQYNPGDGSFGPPPPDAPQLEHAPPAPIEEPAAKDNVLVFAELADELRNLSHEERNALRDELRGLIKAGGNADG